MLAQFPSFPSCPGSFPLKFRQLPVTDNIPIGHQTKWTAFLCFLFVCLFLLFCLVFELGPTLSLFRFWLGPEELWDFKFGKLPPGIGLCLSFI